VGLGTALLLASVALLQPKLYTAQSVVYVEPVVARNLNDLGSPGFDQFRYNSYLDQQMQTVVRTDILTDALKSLPPGTWRRSGETEDDALRRLVKKLVVERPLTSYQISIKLPDKNPEEAAAIVNAVTATYLKGGRKDELEHSDGRLQLLGEERQRVRDELKADRKEQAELGASMGQANPIQTLENPFDASTANIRTQLQTARQQRDVAQAQLESVSGEGLDHRSGLAAAADESIVTDPGLSAEKSAVSARRVALQTTMAGLTPSNPQYKQAQDELAELDLRLEAKTAEVRERAKRRIRDTLRTELQRTAEVEATLNAQLASETAKAAGAGPKLQRAQELAADIARLTARYTTLDEAYSALQIVTTGPGMAHLLLAARVPSSPDPSKADLLLLAALPFGLLCGLSSAVLARHRDGKIYLGSDLAEATGFAPIAVLPARQDVSARVTDEYVLRLAAGIESAYRSAGARSFILTAVSADTTGDTPTTALTCDLARKLEDLRLRVRVLHASELMVASPETMQYRPATVALPAATGKPAMPAGEGIASARLHRMKGEDDILLIEAAPLLHSAETEYAVRCADATILVVESGTTQKSELTEATALLARLNVSGVAAVLDGLRPENADAAFRRSIRVIEQRNLEGSMDRKATIPPVEAPVAPVKQEPVADEPVAAEPPVDVEFVNGTTIEAAVEAATESESALSQPLEQTAGGDEVRPQAEPVADHPILELVAIDDPAPVGRFVSEQDLIQPVPSYTRSKIRLAFKEQEVNSKTTWFSKLFRGGSSDSFRVVPESPGSVDSQDPPAHPTASSLPLDPDVQSLVNRIKPQGDFTFSPRVEEYKAKAKAKAEAAALSAAPGQGGRPVPSVERRSAPREAEPDEPSMAHPLIAVTASAVAEPPAEAQIEAEWAPSRFAYAEPVPPQPPVEWTPAAEDWLRTLRSPSAETAGEPVESPGLDLPVESTPSYLAEPVPVAETTEATPVAEWTPSSWTEPVEPPAPAMRPLRPLTFQQLAGLEPAPAPIPAPAVAIRQSQPESPQVDPAVVVRRIEPIVPAFEPHPEGHLAAGRPVAHKPEPAVLEAAVHPKPEFQPEPEIAAFAQPDVWDAAGVWSANETAPAPIQPPVAQEQRAWLGAPRMEVPANTVIAPNPEAWAQQFGRRSTDRVGPDGKPIAPGLTRRWALLSQFEPTLSDPSPAPRRRSTDFPPQHSDEG